MGRSLRGRASLVLPVRSLLAMRRSVVGSRMKRAVLCLALALCLLVPSIAHANPGPRHKHAKPPVEGVLNLNRASEAELRLLPGIGKGRAAQIVARRQTKPFATLEEVARIKGLRRLVSRLRPHLSLEGPTTLRPAAIASKGGPVAAASATAPP